MKEFFLLLVEVFFIIFIAEMGDKTQFAIMAMTNKYKIKHILLGVSASIIVLSLFAVVAGSFIGNMIPTEWISLVAGVAFFYFAYTTISNEDEEEEKASASKFGPVLSVFGAFTLAELGDKTQLTSLTKAAEEGLDGAVAVFIASALALFAADMIGLFVGYVLGSKLPSSVFAVLSFFIFAVFGVLKIVDGLSIIFADKIIYAVITASSVSLLFALLCIIRFTRLMKEIKANKNTD